MRSAAKISSRQFSEDAHSLHTGISTLTISRLGCVKHLWKIINYSKPFAPPPIDRSSLSGKSSSGSQPLLFLKANRRILYLRQFVNFVAPFHSYVVTLNPDNLQGRAATSEPYKVADMKLNTCFC